jgi:hypothetical protein
MTSRAVLAVLIAFPTGLWSAWAAFVAVGQTFCGHRYLLFSLTLSMWSYKWDYLF